ncbi:proline iminopeptidase [Marivirga lumbricoides]|uniref:Proline iminopeptidase n=1 Tax=Marivirga lumbricoides TaxID=1046115 RepID=A0ABQ1MU97_9BACT|nr:proline iminopeptidase [Marivirga lumbricoides]
MKYIKYSIFFLFAVIISYGCKSQQELTAHEGYVEVEGGKIWYKVLGEGTATPLLLMHGGPGGTHRYFYELEPLSKERPIILFDQLGTGRSGYHTDTTLLKVDKFVEQVNQLKKHLKLEEFYLLGHSWGAALELEYYQAHPQGIKAIIFSSPYVSTPIWTADADTLIMQLPDSVQAYIAEAEATNNYNSTAYQYANELYWSQFGLRSEYKRHPLDTVEASGNSFIYNYMWGPSEFTATGTLKNYDNVQALKAVEVPALFVTGEYDEARPATVKRLQKMVPNSKFAIIDDAGHSTARDNSQQYNEVISQFLKGLEE